VHEFAKMLKTLTGQQLPAWNRTGIADDLPELHTFASGPQRDPAAVTAGLTLPWNSGCCEGHVNRVKMRSTPDVRPRQLLAVTYQNPACSLTNMDVEDR
jgi:hypothetical protein